MQQAHPHPSTMHQSLLSYKAWPLQQQLFPTNHRTSDNSMEESASSCTTASGAAITTTIKGRREKMKSVVSENAVIVIGKRGCCMSHVVKRLLLGLGVNPAIYEFVDDGDEKTVGDELEIMIDDNDKDGGGGGDRRVQFPAVFIGGRLFGGLDRIMATHLSGELTPILRQAGALWL